MLRPALDEAWRRAPPRSLTVSAAEDRGEAAPQTGERGEEITTSEHGPRLRDDRRADKHLAAVELLRATGALAGIRPEFAQTFVSLEVERQGIPARSGAARGPAPGRAGPSPRAYALVRSSRLRILPVGPFGSSSMMSTTRGYL